MITRVPAIQESSSAKHIVNAIYRFAAGLVKVKLLLFNAFFIAVQSEGKTLALAIDGRDADREEFDKDEMEDVGWEQDADASKGCRPLFTTNMDHVDEIEVSSSISDDLL